jgi:Raf kinase inhibitor-like YbhB/YbcL family protein
MQLKSSAFENEDRLPTQYTCEGEGISPPLSWEGVPEEAKVLALVLDDPDANTLFTHWIIYNIPALPPNLEQGASLSGRFSEGMREGFNSYGNQGYGPPCPPNGDQAHRYTFRLYALPEELLLSGRVTRDQLMDRIEGKTLAEAMLVVKFSRG